MRLTRFGCISSKAVLLLPIACKNCQHVATPGHWFSAKRRLSNECRNSILMTPLWVVLPIGQNQLPRGDSGTSSIQCRISASIHQRTLFPGETSGDVTKSQLFYQAASLTTTVSFSVVGPGMRIVFISMSASW